MGDDTFGLSEKGKQTVVGVVSSICHDFDLGQAAVLNGLEDADAVRMLLYLLLVEAGLAEPLDFEEDDD